MSSSSSISVSSRTLEHFTKDDLLNLKAGVFGELEKYAGKINLCVDLDTEYRGRIHAIQKTNAHSPLIQELERQIQGLDAVAVKAKEKYLDAREKLKRIQTALETRFPTHEQAEKEERTGPTVSEVNAKLGETTEDVSKLKETVDGHTVEIARHAGDIEALKKGPARGSDPDSPSAPVSGQVLEVQRGETTGSSILGSGGRGSQGVPRTGGVRTSMIPEQGGGTPAVVTGTGQGSGSQSLPSLYQSTSHRSGQSSSSGLPPTSVRSNVGGSIGGPIDPSSSPSSPSLASIHPGSSVSQSSSSKDGPPSDEQTNEPDPALIALQGNFADIDNRVSQHDETISLLGKTQEEHTALLASHDDAINRQIEITNGLKDQVDEHDQILGQHRETVANHDVHLGYHADGIKDMSSKVNDQSLVLARVDTKLRHYDEQLNAYQKDGRILAAQGQKIEHIEEKVQGNNARVEQVEKVVESLQEKGKDAPVVWPWVAAGGGLLATIAGLGAALYIWKKQQSRKAKTVKDGLYSETEDGSEIDSGVDTDGAVNLATVQGRRKGQGRRRPRPNRLHARQWNPIDETQL